MSPIPLFPDWLRTAGSACRSSHLGRQFHRSRQRGRQRSASWPTDHIGWRLQTQTNTPATGLGDNWFDVPNSAATNSMTLPVDENNDSVFFRLSFP